MPSHSPSAETARSNEDARTDTSRVGTSIEAEDIRDALEKFGTIPKSSRIGAYLGTYHALLSGHAPFVSPPSIDTKYGHHPVSIPNVGAHLIRLVTSK